MLLRNLHVRPNPVDMNVDGPVESGLVISGSFSAWSHTVLLKDPVVSPLTVSDLSRQKKVVREKYKYLVYRNRPRKSVDLATLDFVLARLPSSAGPQYN